MKTQITILVLLTGAVHSVNAGIIASWGFNATATDVNGTLLNGTGSGSVTGTPTLTPTAGGTKVTVSETGTTLKYAGTGNPSQSVGDLNNSKFVISLTSGAALSGFTITYSVKNGASGPTDVAWARTGGSGSVTITVTPAATPVSTSFTSYTATFTGLTVSSGNSLTFTASFSGATGSSGSIEFDSLEVNAVPEPANVAMGLFGIGFVGIAAGRKLLKRTVG